MRHLRFFAFWASIAMTFWCSLSTDGFASSTERLYSISELVEQYNKAATPDQRERVKGELEEFSTFDGRAAVALSDILFDEGIETRVQLDRALSYLYVAGQKGNVTALRRLGDRYLEWSHLGLDQGKAVTYFMSAADAGDAKSYLRLGDLSRDGTVAAPDIERAKMYYQLAINGGEFAGNARLGDLILAKAKDKTDVVEAVLLYERGHKNGDAASGLRLADVQRDGKLGQPNLAKAESLYRQLYKDGSERAGLRLARLLLQRDRPQIEEARSILQNLFEKHNFFEAAVDFSRIYTRGLAGGINFTRAQEILIRGAEGGSADAAEELVLLQLQVPGSDSKSIISELDKVVKRFDDILDPARKKRLIFVRKFVAQENEKSYAEFYDQLTLLPPMDRIEMLSTFRRFNPNILVGFMQEALQRKGEKIVASGSLNGKTIGLLYKYCKQYKNPSVCSGGPLSYNYLEFAASL